MLIPTWVNIKYFFYPVGNTPAVNLLRDFRPHGQENVEILSIACGDVRNILFSLWSEESLTQSCNFNFTACDLDPAVLARNIFLLSLIIKKNGSTDALAPLWRFYYHFFVTGDDLILIHEHATELYAAANSMTAWINSSFGDIFKFLNESTLAELRPIWKSYTQLPSTERDTQTRQAITFIFTTHHGGARTSVSGMRNAGCHGPQALDMMSQAFFQYWKTGVVSGNQNDLDILHRDNGGQVNPLMSISAMSSSPFAVHYGTDPLFGYHLAPAFDHNLANSRAAMNAVAKQAKSEFYGWCRAFSRCVASKSVTIRFHCGEAVNFGHELQSLQGSPLLSANTRQYVKPWRASPLSLNSIDTTTRFDIIDTSNLIDHVGILNLLPSVTPLLKSDPASIIYTESLVRAAENQEDVLNKLLHTDVTTLSLLLGITPVGFVTGNTTESIYSEQFLSFAIEGSKGQRTQFRMRIPWRRPLSGDRNATRLSGDVDLSSSLRRINMDPLELASFLMQMYLNMFKEGEDITIRMEVMLRTLKQPLIGDCAFYSRLTLVAIIAIAKQTVITDWDACLNALVRMIENDRSLILGSNNLQELYLHLHTSGLWEISTLRSNPRSGITGFGLPRPPGEPGILGRADVPHIVHVALVVPRVQLSVFTSRPAEQVGTPALHMSVAQGPMYENQFHAFDSFFGRIVDGSGTNPAAVIEEDLKGWSGTSDLIVTCAVPTWGLLVGLRDTLQIALVVDTTTQTTHYANVLGLHMRVFAAGLDSKHVRITTQPFKKQCSNKLPVLESTPRAQNGSPTDQDSSTLPTVNLQRNGTVKVTIRTKFSKQSAENKALVDGAEVVVSQSSPCVMKITIDQLVNHVTFPYPINGKACRTRIARKSSWVELIVPTSAALQPGGFHLTPFPVVDQSRNDQGDMLAWSLSRTQIDLQPSISPSTSSWDWMQSLLGTSLSRTERIMNTSTEDPSKPPLLQFKETIHILFYAAVGRHPQAPGKIMKLTLLTENNDGDTMIFAKELRHDLDLGSIMLDAFYVPVTPARLEDVSFKTAMENGLRGTQDLQTMDVTNEEMVVWKHLLPAIAERCRTWEHEKDCEYKSSGTIPLSVDHGEEPVCSCGYGKDAQHMPQEFKAFAKFATRIAIPLVSAVPYVEPTMPEGFEKAQFKKKKFQSKPQPEAKDEMSQSSQSSSSKTEKPQSASDSQSSVPIDDQAQRVFSQVQRPPGHVLGEIGEEVDTCGHCGSIKAGLKPCGRCGIVKYCNHTCQKAEWRTHKKGCNKK